MVSRAGLAAAVRDWRSLAALLAETGRDVDRLGTDVLPPRVREPGEAFLATWAGLVGEARTEAEGLVTSLEETLRDFSRVEDEVVELLVNAPAGALSDRLGRLP